MKIAYVVQNTRQGFCTWHAADDSGVPICGPGKRGHVESVYDEADCHGMDCGACARILKLRAKRALESQMRAAGQENANGNA